MELEAEIALVSLQARMPARLSTGLHGICKVWIVHLEEAVGPGELAAEVAGWVAVKEALP